MRRNVRREIRIARKDDKHLKEMRFVLNVDVSSFVKAMQEMAARVNQMGKLFNISTNGS